MTVITITPPIEPRVHRWSRDEFYFMGDLGWFQDQHVELIDGEIFEMPPPGNVHCVTIECGSVVLRNVFGNGYWVRAQMPLSLGLHSDPLPDIAVVKGISRDFTVHPGTALLVVEVSDSSLRFDRTRKASLYARAGIQDYWIVNLVDRQPEVYRQPIPDENAPYGFRYADVKILTPNDRVSSLATPQTSIAVADLLP